MANPLAVAQRKSMRWCDDEYGANGTHGGNSWVDVGLVCLPVRCIQDRPIWRCDSGMEGDSGECAPLCGNKSAGVSSAHGTLRAKFNPLIRPVPGG